MSTLSPTVNPENAFQDSGGSPPRSITTVPLIGRVLKCTDEDNKRIFESKEDAESFVQINREKFGQQYAYSCPHADHWHLTSSPPMVIGAPKLAATNYSELGKTAARGRRHRLSDDEKEQIVNLKAQGKSHSEIEKIVGVSAPTISKTISAAKNQPFVPRSLESIDTRRKQLDDQFRQLEEQRRRLDQEEQRLQELRAIKIRPWNNNGDLRIEQRYERMVIALEDIPELIDKLTEHLEKHTAPPARSSAAVGHPTEGVMTQ
jgi:transposase-like protein